MNTNKVCAECRIEIPNSADRRPSDIDTYRCDQCDAAWLEMERNVTILAEIPLISLSECFHTIRDAGGEFVTITATNQGSELLPPAR